MTREIGFVGVGRMGGPMASRLIEAGYRLHVFDRSPEAVAALVAKGAAAAQSPAEVATRAATVLLSLPTPEVVHQVALGRDGIAAGGAIRTYVDLSTTGPVMATTVAAALAQQGIAVLDAPVSGGVAGAVKGTLAIMVAGAPAPVADVQPLLEQLGRVFHVGDRPGLGQVMKLANNMLSATAMAASAEVMVMGVKAGLDPRVMIEVINAGTGANTAIRDKFPKAVLPRTFNQGFATGLMFKDVKLCLDEAERLHTPASVLSAVRQLWAETNARFGPESDFTAIVRLVEEWAGVEVKPPES
ncbi:MAG TPA: NAD(P)-dependent oxidoreductase [Kiloniellales bacterium]|nr:NAD(P)-dependent oxidoreductase [Kiloniellales bacterium]